MRPKVGAAVLFALAAAAPDPGQLRALFPQAVEAPEVDKDVVLHPAGAPDIRVTPVRFRPRDGVAPVRDTHLCGLAIADGRAAAQGVVTLGSGYTETLACSGLAAVGLVPATADGQPRIGLIYDTATMRDALRTPVVLVRDAAAGWTVDEAATEAADGGLHPARTIPALRAKLSAPRPPR